MKRAAFLGSAGAAMVAGCAGHGMRALPSVAGRHDVAAPAAYSVLKFIPEVPDPIPATVLANPIVGEARRFAGAAAPPNWMFMQGQSLSIAQYPALFATLGPGKSKSKSTTTFTLPSMPTPMIVAVAGNVMTSPQSLSATRRDFTQRASLGPGAVMPPQSTPKPVPAALAKDRELIARQIAVSNAGPQVPPAGTLQRIADAREGARSSALSALTSQARATVTSSIEAAMRGDLSLNAASQRIAQSLNSSDVRAVLETSDALERSLSGNAASHDEPQAEAARFLLNMLVTPEQAAAIAQHE